MGKWSREGSPILLYFYTANPATQIPTVNSQPCLSAVRWCLCSYIKVIYVW